PSLHGVAMGEMHGDALSAAGWIEVRPAEFTLRPERTQNVRVITRVPRDGIDHANYYAALVFTASYPDGQSAGETRSTVTVTNRAVATEAAASADRLSVASQEGDVYVIHGQFSNIGNVHLNPSADAEVVGDGGRVVAQTVLTGEETVMLPFGVRQFAGVI